MTEKMNKIIINAENAVLGRLASYASKQALQGKEIIIVNSEKAIISGRKEDILERYIKKRDIKGMTSRGPSFPSEADRILKRTIRGMLPKEGRGREAFKRVKCFIGIPDEFKDKKMVKSVGLKKGISLENVARMLRGGA